MARFPKDAFVPNGDDRKETAAILVGTAEEFGIDTRAIRPTSKGFFITNELADILGGAEPEPEPEPAKVTKTRQTKKTSGNRAAKTNDSEEE